MSSFGKKTLPGLVVISNSTNARQNTQKGAKTTCKTLIKNEKYFVAPQKNSVNFNVLFARVVAEGVGRPVDQYGFADGPWTPETLADAITLLPQ